MVDWKSGREVSQGGNIWFHFEVEVLFTEVMLPVGLAVAWEIDVLLVRFGCSEADLCVLVCDLVVSAGGISAGVKLELP